ncbi:MAG: hypothetical protein ACO2ER_06215, partial [Castellaniella sp.]
MNMPVLPVTSSSPPPTDSPARGADAAAATDAPAFSNVLSHQRDGVARPAESRRTEGAGRRADADAAERHDPLGPDETLALILDSAALPLMRASAPTAETGPTHAGRTAHAEPRAARLTVDVAGRASADTFEDSPDARPSGEDGAAGRMRMPGTEMAAAVPVVRTPLHADLSAPSDPRESTRAKTVSSQAQQFHPRASGQMPDAERTPSAQAAANGLFVESARHLRTAPGLEVPAPDGAALASASAPVGATLLPATAPMPTAAPVAVPTPLSNPQWPQDFSRQILHLTQNLNGAGNTVHMHVNPPELGPIHITLHVGDSIAQAS